MKWQDPPDTRNAGSAEWQAIADQLRSRPGEWALIQIRETAAKAGSTARNIKSGVLASFREREQWDAVSRTTDEGYCVYARYVGGSDD